MPRATWLADVLRDAGLHVIEMDGWRTRGAERFTPKGIVWHHTATPKAASDARVRRLLRDGRPDLKGPLCQLGLERDGTFVVIAAGRSNHAGYGKPWGNDSIGIEAYNDGKGEPWPQPLLDAYDAGTAAICRYLGLSITEVRAHREVDPNRKIDPRGIDMDKARARVAALLDDEEFDMDEKRLREIIREENDRQNLQIVAAVKDVLGDAVDSVKAHATTIRDGLAKLIRGGG